MEETAEETIASPMKVMDETAEGSVASPLWWRTSRRLLGSKKLQLVTAATTVHDADFPGLLRGVPVSTLLSRCGAILDNTDILARHHAGQSGLTAVSAAPADAVYALSRPAERLACFISHSWSTPRAPKWMALCCYFRAQTAIRRTVAVSVVGCVAQLLGWVPPGLLGPRLLCSSSGARVFMSSVSFWCGGAAFAATMLLGLRGAAESERLCFLDKACIHQTDASRKAAGIRSMGGFVSRSRTLLALWTEDYFTRLWCIFELACHAAITGGLDNATILPLSFADIFITTQVILKLSVAPGLVKTWLEDSPGGSDAAIAVCGVVYNISNVVYPWLWVRAFRMRMKDVLAMRSQLEGFECQRARCFDPADRQLILGCIEVWFGSAEEFDEYVHLRAAPRLLHKHGRVLPIVPVPLVLVVCVAFIGEFLDALPYHLHEPQLLLDNFLVMVPGFFLTMSLSVYGFSVVCLLMLGLERHGMPEWLSLAVGVSLGNLVITLAVLAIPYPLYLFDTLPFAARVAYVVLLCCLLWWHDLTACVLKLLGREEDPGAAVSRLSLNRIMVDGAHSVAQCCSGALLLALLIFVVAPSMLMLAVTLLPVCPSELKAGLAQFGLTCGITTLLTPSGARDGSAYPPVL